MYAFLNFAVCLSHHLWGIFFHKLYSLHPHTLPHTASYHLMQPYCCPCRISRACDLRSYVEDQTRWTLHSSPTFAHPTDSRTHVCHVLDLPETALYARSIPHVRKEPQPANAQGSQPHRSKSGTFVGECFGEQHIS